jgi:AraC-like DNA-binding protein
MLLDRPWFRLQRSRIILYKSRMDDATQTLRRGFFGSLGDAAQLLRLFDFLPHVYLYVKDTQGRFVAMNNALVRMRGATDEDDLIGKTDLELHPVYWGRLYQEEDRRVMEAGKEIPGQVWLVPAEDGELGTFVSSKMPVRSHDQTIIGIAGVMYRLDRAAASSNRTDPIEAATDMIRTQFAESLEINEIAVAVGLSVSQLNRRFRALYQISPSEYLQRVRVHEASRLLAEADDLISDVALQTGFYDQAHLTRTFRRWIGMTPAEFRKAATQFPAQEM